MSHQIQFCLERNCAHVAHKVPVCVKITLMKPKSIFIFSTIVAAFATKFSGLF